MDKWVWLVYKRVGGHVKHVNVNDIAKMKEESRKKYVKKCVEFT
jgi:hypothetical protein